MMDTLFAPWRIDWVERNKSEKDFNCIFCDLPDRNNDRENLILARSEFVYVLLNNMPYNPGHVMIIPLDHGGRYQDVNDKVLFDCMSTSQQVITAIDESLSPNGYNIGFNINSAGGASITDHLHMHVIPRWDSDTSFMPTIGNTAIVEEAVKETYDRLYESLLLNDWASLRDDYESVCLKSKHDRN